MTRLNIYIADDHALFRQSFVRILKENRKVGLVREASDGKALLALLEAAIPDLVILDIEMPGLDGIQVCKKIAARYPEVKIMVISMHEEKLTIARALKHGASVYLAKTADVGEFEAAFEAIASGRSYMNALMKEAMHYGQMLDNDKGALQYKPDISDKQKAIISLIQQTDCHRALIE